MSSIAKAYLEHVAIWVRDIHWHIRFFHDVLGMTMREVEGPADNPRQYWTLGGMQFIASPEFAGPEGRLAPPGRDVRGPRSCARRRAGTSASSEMPQGRNWLRLPDGLAVELIQASRQRRGRSAGGQPARLNEEYRNDH